MKVRRFLIKHCDPITRWLAVVMAVLAGSGGGLLWGSYEANRSAEKRITDVQNINLSLIQTLQKQVKPLVQQQADVVEQQSAVSDKQSELSDKLDKTTDRVESAATKSSQAATTASQAASRAGQATRKFQAPVSTFRLVPNRHQPPKCWSNNKDVFGDPCQ